MDRRPDGLLISVLGPVEVSVGSQTAGITQPGLRALVAMLALSANRVVPASALIDGLWQEEPSRARERNLHAGVYQLRKRLRALEPGRDADRLITRQPGYQLAVAPGELDLAQFTALAERGRESARRADHTAAADLFRQALELWRGEALADVAGLSDRLTASAAVLDRQRLDVQADRADAVLAAGHSAGVIAELTELVDAHPFHERLRGQLMLALYQSGRQADALACYQAGWQVLRDELGVEPGPDLRQLQHRILRADPALAPARPGATAGGEPGEPAADKSAPPGAAGPAAGTGPESRVNALPPRTVPRQLPPGVRHFAGRQAELTQLDALLHQGAPGGAAVITAIGGTGGVGKTALALHWAHQVAHRFPDGHLYVNLRGYDPGGVPVAPEEAIRGFLEALSIPAARIPAAPEGQSALYRTVLADRRMLILLDNARTAAQVRPLLPAAPGCFVIITSRATLSGLSISDGSAPVSLGLASQAEAEAILAVRLGPDRVAAEPASVAQLIMLCARLPLALAIAAARAAARPTVPLAALVTQMSREQDRLDALDVGDSETSLRAVFSWSTRQLSAAAARMFWLLGLHPGPDVTVAVAASLAGVAWPEARRALLELENASLLSEHAPGRYAFHDLLRVFAGEQAAESETTASLQAATSRFLDHYLYTARQAGALIFGASLPLPALAPLPGGAVRPEELRTSREAINWFDAQHQVLIAAVLMAEAQGLDSYVWQLPCTMTEYFRAVGRMRDWARLNRIALAAAERLGESDALGRVHFSIGTHARITGAFAEAVSQLGRSMDYFRATGDLTAQAAVHLGISSAHVQRRPTLPAAEPAADVRAMLDHASRARELYREAGDKAGQARALNDLAAHHLALGELLTAEDCSGEAIRLSVETGDWVAEMVATSALGRISYGLGLHDQAVANYLRCLTLTSETGSPIRPPSLLEDLGDAYLAAGNAAAAEAAWREVMDLARQLDQAGEEPYWRTDQILAKLQRLAEDDSAASCPADSHSSAP
jgi:DNA-binding SARP family transcriptional activator/tetratricopeptide (TPR) repeat protein